MISEYVPNAAALTSRATTTVRAKLPKLYSSWSTIPMPARRRPRVPTPPSPPPGRCSGNVEVRRVAEFDEFAAGRCLEPGGEARVEFVAPAAGLGLPDERGCPVRRRGAGIDELRAGLLRPHRLGGARAQRRL